MTTHFWEATYEKNIGKMIDVCRRYTPNKQVAEDLAHDAFIIAIEKYQSFENKGAFEGWLRKITINLALQYIREQKKQKYTEEVDLLTEIEEENRTNEFYAFTEAELLQFVNLLPEHHKLVFNLYVIDGLTHAQIGLRLGISEGTSKSHLARARKKLRELIFEKTKQKKKVFGLLLLPFQLFDIDSVFKKKLKNLTIKPTKVSGFINERFQKTSSFNSTQFLPKTFLKTNTFVSTSIILAIVATSLYVIQPASKEKRNNVSVPRNNQIKNNSIKLISPKKIIKETATISDNSILREDNIKNSEEMKTINTLGTLLLAGASFANDSTILSKNMKDFVINQDVFDEKMKNIEPIKPLERISQIEKKIEEQGTFKASKLFWSAENYKIYISGTFVKGSFNSNDFGGIGTFTFMEKVGLLVLDGMHRKPGETIKLSNKKYKVIKLSSEEAIRKYGEIGKTDVVEITATK